VQLYFFSLFPNIRHIPVPLEPRINNTKAAPKSLPLPNGKCSDSPLLLIHGSQTLPTINYMSKNKEHQKDLSKEAAQRHNPQKNVEELMKIYESIIHPDL
jgi:hypothetical protein